MKIVLVDNAQTVERLKPLTFTRPVSDLRVGALTIAEKWTHRGFEVLVRAASAAVSKIYPEGDSTGAIEVASEVIPDDAVAAALRQTGAIPAGARRLETVPDIFRLNGEETERDIALLTEGRSAGELDASCTVIGPRERLFVEDGVEAYAATFNTLSGPIILMKGSTVMDGSVIKGPTAICEGSTVNPNAVIWPATTIGPHCKVGGEINNAVFQGYSNKAHDGFLGNAVIGHWCNLGAGCTSSNLKNDYSTVKLWSYAEKSFVRTGMQFCGLIMGDHSKAAINTSFNTATTVGVGCNIHGAGFPRTLVPSFSIGGAQGFKPVPFSRFIETARRVMARRHVELTEELERFYHGLYEMETAE